MIHRAIEFAVLAHAGQIRKSTKIPYIVHPFEVAQILTAAGADETVICAGLLHDTVEDTSTTIEDIADQFGNQVAALVASCSENKTLSWEQRKNHTIQQLKTGESHDTQLIYCADKLSNLRSIALDYKKQGEDIWKVFNRDREHQKWYYGAIVQALSSLKDYQMYKELADLYKAVFEKL